MATALSATSDAAPPDTLPPEGTVTRAWARPFSTRPAVVSGVLAGPHDGSPVLVARAYLSTSPEVISGVSPSSLRAERVRWHANGAAVRFQQTWGGLDVVGGVVIVRVDDDGRVRWASSGTTPIPASFDAAAWIDEAAAIAQVTDDGIGTARLVILGDPVQDRPRLAWEVTVPRDLLTMQSLRAWVDAQDGRVLHRDDAARAADASPPWSAHVYPVNPVVTPSLAVEALAGLPVGSTRLVGDEVTAVSCLDLRSCTPFGELSYHFCEPVGQAMAGTDGTFLAILPPLVPSNPNDPFAEIQAYYHATRALAAFETWSEDPGFVAPKVTVVANFRRPQTTAGARCTSDTAPVTSQLAPFEGAMFAPAHGAVEGDWILLGQGMISDMAYDGDLVTHEVAHAVLAASSELGLAATDAFGLDPSPAGLHEGYADYFAAVLGGDSEIAEYAGRGSEAVRPSGALRTADNALVCPADLSGDPHRDGSIWLGALWQLRASRAVVDRPVIDAAVFTSMDSLGAVDTFGVAQAVLVAEIELMLGKADADAAQAIFSARGLDGCDGRVLETAFGASVPVYRLSGAYGGVQAPGPTQLAVDLFEDAQELVVEFDDVEVLALPGQAAVPDLRAIVKGGGEPIVWSWDDGVATSDADLSGRIIANPIAGAGGGAIRGPFEPGRYHVQIVNESGATIVLRGLRVIARAGGGGNGDGGPDASPTTPVDPVDGQQGCACAVGPSSRGGGSVAMLLLAVGLTLFVRRCCRSTM